MGAQVDRFKTLADLGHEAENDLVVDLEVTTSEASTFRNPGTSAVQDACFRAIPEDRFQGNQHRLRAAVRRCIEPLLHLPNPRPLGRVTRVLPGATLGRLLPLPRSNCRCR